MVLLYSWRFSRYSGPIHWPVHCHMTSNKETVSRQMPWVGNIATTVTSNGKQFTVTREMLTAVARHLLINKSIGLTHLLCYITNHLMSCPLGNSDFVSLEFQGFPGLRLGKDWDSRETKFTVPYAWVARDVIIFENPKLESHQSYNLHQAWERVNLYLLTTFQRRNMLRLKEGTF